MNNFGFPGFPEINVSGNPDESFSVMLRWNKASSVQFRLSIEEVESAVKRLKAGTGYDPVILKKVQEALIDLESKAYRYRTI